MERAAAIGNADADALRKDIIFLDADAVRIVYEFYARDSYNANSLDGSDAVRALLQIFADNKIVEDVHQPLRLDARANVNKKMAHRHIEDVILEAEVLESRGIRNPCRLTKEVWRKDYRFARRRQARSKRTTHKAYSRKLPKLWSKIMKPYSKKHGRHLTSSRCRRPRRLGIG